MEYKKTDPAHQLQTWRTGPILLRISMHRGERKNESNTNV